MTSHAKENVFSLSTPSLPLRMFFFGLDGKIAYAEVAGLSGIPKNFKGVGARGY